MDPENHIFHEIYSICVHNYWKKSKNAKLIPWLDMKILKKSKNAKLIPWLDMKIVKKSKIPKLIPWPDMTLLNFHIFGVQLCIKISIFNEKSNFWYSDHPEITPCLHPWVANSTSHPCSQSPLISLPEFQSIFNMFS